MAKSKANLNYWRPRIDVDYFTQFIKTYLYFNGWYRHEFGPKPTDADIINSLKNKSNIIRNNILPLFGQTVSRNNKRLKAESLDKETAEIKRFKQAVANLHFGLEDVIIEDEKGGRISFSSVYISKNPKPKCAFELDKISYSVDATTSNDIKITVYDTKSKQTLFNPSAQTSYNWNTVKDGNNFDSLPPGVVTQLKVCYDRANPRLMVDLTKSQTNETFLIGGYEFCDNKEHLFAGLVEIIYQLRCHLFHGGTLPSSKANNTYGAAYAVLRELLREADEE